MRDKRKEPEDEGEPVWRCVTALANTECSCLLQPMGLPPGKPYPQLLRSICQRQGWGEATGKNLFTSSWIGHRQALRSDTLPTFLGCSYVCAGGSSGRTSRGISGAPWAETEDTLCRHSEAPQALPSSLGSGIALLTEIYTKVEYVKLDEPHM